MNTDTIREARDKLCELELNLCNYDDDDVRQLQNNIFEAVAVLEHALAALSTIDPDELERVKKERDAYFKLWWGDATETHNQLCKLYDDQNARMWAILKRPECPEGLAQRMLKMPETDRDYFLSLAVDTLAHDDAIRRECAERAVKWYNEPDNQNYLEKYDDDEYWDCQLRDAILGKEGGKE